MCVWSCVSVKLTTHVCYHVRDTYAHNVYECKNTSRTFGFRFLLPNVKVGIVELLHGKALITFFKSIVLFLYFK